MGNTAEKNRETICVCVLQRVGLDQPSYCTLGQVNTWMGDRLWVNHLGITSHLGEFSLSSFHQLVLIPLVHWRTQPSLPPECSLVHTRGQYRLQLTTLGLSHRGLPQCSDQGFSPRELTRSPQNLNRHMHQIKCNMF